MKQYKGAIFCDIDGTLVDESAEIFIPTQQVRDALHKVKEKGYLIGVATGRAECYIPDMKIDFDCYVSCNGAVATVNGKEMFSDTFGGGELKEILGYLEEQRIGYSVENPKACFYNKAGEEEVMRVIEIFHMNKSVFFPLESISGLRVNKLMISFDDPRKYDGLVERFGEKYLIPMHRNGMSADFGKRSINKASGIHAVIEKLNIPRENTYAFGDYDNDVEMLGEVGHGIAMTPHSSKLEGIAEYITGSVSENGICQGLRQYGLIE
ncbi:MAG: HAD family phosphatase [Clostridia bacterium]|nr:HAD family phosphatase [Clostridia bacterium]